MRTSVALLLGLSALCAGCGSRTGLALAWLAPRTDAGLGDGDAGHPDAGHADAGFDAGVRDGPCRWGFAPAARYDLFGFPADIAIGDFDGDRVPDVLTVTTGDGLITVLHNRGEGALSLGSTSAAGTMPAGFAVADFTGE